MKTTSLSTNPLPLYRRLVDEYKDAILMRRLVAGERVDSISVMMKRHGIARETAKRVLNILANEGLIIQRPGKGSYVANLEPSRTVWAVVLPYFSLQYQDLLHHIIRQADAQGRKVHHFLDHNNWQEEIRLVGRLVNERYEAVIVAPTLDEPRTASFYATLSPRETCVTLIDHTMAGSSFSSVTQNYERGLCLGADRLLNKSTGTLLFIGNEIWTGRNPIQESMAGDFRTIVCETRGSEKCRIIDRADLVNAPFIRCNKIDGIFCCDEIDAVRVIGRLNAEGVKIPGECAVVSYGNTELSTYFTPGITSLDPHNGDMARLTAEILKKKIAGENTEFSQFVVQPELIIRDT